MIHVKCENQNTVYSTDINCTILPILIICKLVSELFYSDKSMKLLLSFPYIMNK